MDTNQMSVGDVVKLKSGGPFMTVTCGVGSSNVTCVWFANDGLHEGYFPPKALESAVYKGESCEEVSRRGR